MLFNKKLVKIPAVWIQKLKEIDAQFLGQEAAEQEILDERRRKKEKLDNKKNELKKKIKAFKDEQKRKAKEEADRLKKEEEERLAKEAADAEAAAKGEGGDVVPKDDE